MNIKRAFFRSLPSFLLVTMVYEAVLIGAMTLADFSLPQMGLMAIAVLVIRLLVLADSLSEEIVFPRSGRIGDHAVIGHHVHCIPCCYECRIHEEIPYKGSIVRVYVCPECGSHSYIDSARFEVLK